MSYHGIPKVFQTEADKCPWLRSNSCSSSVLSSDERVKCDSADTDIYQTQEQCVAKKKKFERIELPHDLCSTVQSRLESSSGWNDFLTDYISKCRINLNVRQVRH
jgi:hypothetical protein